VKRLAGVEARREWMLSLDEHEQKRNQPKIMIDFFLLVWLEF
jgi:hypothetical protein